MTNMEWLVANHINLKDITVDYPISPNGSWTIKYNGKDENLNLGIINIKKHSPQDALLYWMALESFSITEEQKKYLQVVAQPFKEFLSYISLRPMTINGYDKGDDILFQIRLVDHMRFQGMTVFRKYTPEELELW